MNRRGVIPVLLLFFTGSFDSAKEKEEQSVTTTFQVDIPEKLTVRYKDRVVRFTADELMDILEEKPRIPPVGRF